MSKAGYKPEPRVVPQPERMTRIIGLVLREQTNTIMTRIDIHHDKLVIYDDQGSKFNVVVTEVV